MEKTEESVCDTIETLCPVQQRYRSSFKIKKQKGIKQNVSQNVLFFNFVVESVSKESCIDISLQLRTNEDKMSAIHSIDS